MGVGKSWGQGSKVHPHRLLPVTLPGAPVVCLPGPMPALDTHRTESRFLPSLG